MTDLRTAAQQALEAMSSFESGTNGLYEGEFAEEISALRAALVEDAMQKFTDVNQELEAALAEEPVWVCPDSAEHRYKKPGHCEDCGKTLVQEPPEFPSHDDKVHAGVFARAIERAHGIT